MPKWIGNSSPISVKVPSRVKEGEHRDGKLIPSLFKNVVSIWNSLVCWKCLSKSARVLKFWQELNFYL